MVPFVLYMKNNNINKHFARLYAQDLLLLLREIEKTCIFTQKWLGHILLMTSYIVIIETAHQ